MWPGVRRTLTPMSGDGILSEPIDLDGGAPRQPIIKRVQAVPGLWVSHRTTSARGAVVRVEGAGVVLRDDEGRDHLVRLTDGAFTVAGARATLVPPTPEAVAAAGRTASGSVAVPTPARIARASRIWVEGVHDAELLEAVWGDDLRAEGIVVEPMHGMDDLAELVRGFGPRPARRLGVLLDHLVPGSKESRAASGVDHPDVLVTGHPFVDVWQAVRPQVVGIDAWPEIPKGQSWKDGVCAALGVSEPAVLWKQILGSVRSFADLEPSLVGAVEQLIDFVAADS